LADGREAMRKLQQERASRAAESESHIHVSFTLDGEAAPPAEPRIVH
jgi:hypothetical protein